jgi:hypothetical protein
VTANGKRWAAKITYDGNMHRLGTFDTREEAALAYDKKARQCGKDKLLNYESNKAAEEAAVQAQVEHILVHDMCAGPKQPKPQQPKPRPPSGFYGVYANGKRWQAQIYFDSNRHSLGTFDTKQEAASQSQAEHVLVHDPACTNAKIRAMWTAYGRDPSTGARWQLK